MYIIAGPNGAGKTTLSYSVLPEIFDCDEFVNADEIARGISPLNTKKAGFRAGRLMLERIKELVSHGEVFAFETTLSTKSYQGFIKSAMNRDYKIVLLFLTLDSIELAIQRVQTRVQEGGHDIPVKIIERRYKRGLINFFKVYKDMVDEWIMVDNSTEKFHIIAEGNKNNSVIRNDQAWKVLNELYNEQ